MSAVWRLDAAPGEVCGPDQARVVAQQCRDDASLGPVSAASQLPFERLARRGQQQVTRSAQAAADHKGAGIESRRQVGDAEPQPVADLGQQLTSRWVTLAGGLGDQRAGQIARNTLGAIEQVPGKRGVGREQRARFSHQCIAAGVLLPTPAVAALATVTARDDLHVPELPRNAEATTLNLTVDQDAATDAGAQRDHHELGLALRHPELPLGTPHAARLSELCAGDPDRLTGPDVTSAAAEGDPAAVELLSDLGTWIGEGAAAVTAILDPELIVLGGGVAEAGGLLIDPAVAAFRRHLTGRGHRPEARFVVATLGNDAGMIGAADLAARAHR